MGRGRLGRTDVDSFKEFIRRNALSITSIVDPELLNNLCETIRQFAKRDKAKYTQIRNIYNAIKNIDRIEELVSLRPILAYIGARNNISDLTNFLDDLIKNIRSEDQLRSFKKFMEMFICYKRVERN